MHHNNADAILTRPHALTELRCPVPRCNLAEMTQVVGVHWEKGKRVQMDVRCEKGHAFLLTIRNHAGAAYVEWEIIA